MFLFVLCLNPVRLKSNIIAICHVFLLNSVSISISQRRFSETNHRLEFHENDKFVYVSNTAAGTAESPFGINVIRLSENVKLIFCFMLILCSTLIYYFSTAYAFDKRLATWGCIQADKL